MIWLWSDLVRKIGIREECEGVIWQGANMFACCFTSSSDRVLASSFGTMSIHIMCCEPTASRSLTSRVVAVG
jgi:hypothetical protein